MSSSRTDLQHAKDEIARLHEVISRTCRYLDKAENVANDGRGHTEQSTAEVDLVARVKRLVESYDTLQREKEEVVKRYAADYQKWRRFKQWLLGGNAVERARARESWGILLDKENVPSTSRWDGDGANHVPLDVHTPTVPPKATQKSPSSVPSPGSHIPTLPILSERVPLQVAAIVPTSTSETSDQGHRSEADSTPTRATALSVPRAHAYRPPAKEVDPSFKSEREATKEVEPKTEMSNVFEVEGHEKPAEFKYDEVVRNKEERKRLHGGDCECCRDYYEAIGPLPTRPNAPLWRTPPSSPTKHRPNEGSCSNADADTVAHEIEEHKQQISRHRARWEAPKTPPAYWNIGFPDTQEAASINLRAEEMRARKKARTDSEPRKAKRDQKR